MKESMDRNDKVFDIILEEAFDKYAKDVADYEPEVEMTEEDVRIMDSKKDNIYNNIMKGIVKDKKKKSPTKLLIPLVAVLILVLAYSTNTFAFRTFLHQTFMSITGTDLNFNTKKLVFEDYNNIVNFENKEEIIVPGWLPDDMVLYKILDENENLGLYFKNDVYWVTITAKIDSNDEKAKIETENNEYKITKTTVLDMNCDVVEITSESNMKVSMAYWNSIDTNYSIMTNIQRSNLDKILEYLRYFEE